VLPKGVVGEERKKGGKGERKEREREREREKRERRKRRGRNQALFCIETTTRIFPRCEVRYASRAYLYKH